VETANTLSRFIRQILERKINSQREEEYIEEMKSNAEICLTFPGSLPKLKDRK